MRIALALALTMPLLGANALGAQAALSRGFSVAVLAQQARVHTALDDLLPPERSVALLGLGVSTPTPWRMLHIEVRALRSPRGREDLHSLEGLLIVGGDRIGIEAGYAQRGSYSPETGLAHSRVADFARAGLRLGSGPLRSGFETFLSASAYVPLAPGDEENLEGWDAATALSYRPPRFPLTTTLGYRLERFRIFGVEQEVSSLTFGVGFTPFGR